MKIIYFIKKVVVKTAYFCTSKTKMIRIRNISAYLFILVLALFAHTGSRCSGRVFHSFPNWHSQRSGHAYEITPISIEKYTARNQHIKVRYKGGECPDLSSLVPYSIGRNFPAGHKNVFYYSPNIPFGYYFSYSSRGPPVYIA